jgi:hypothetical protein
MKVDLDLVYANASATRWNSATVSNPASGGVPARAAIA